MNYPIEYQGFNIEGRIYKFQNKEEELKFRLFWQMGIIAIVE